MHGVLITLEASNLAEGLEVSKGDIVTFSYDAINFQSLPSHIKILRIRNDITWEDVSIIFIITFYFLFIFYQFCGKYSLINYLLTPSEDFSKMISSTENRQTMLNGIYLYQNIYYFFFYI